MTNKVNIADWLYLEMEDIKNHWGILTQDYRVDRSRRLSHQRVIELLVAHAALHPPTPEFLKTFEFKTGVRGRPRRSELESVDQPAVSEEPLDQSEDRTKTTEDVGIDQRGDFGISRDRAAYPDDTRR